MIIMIPTYDAVEMCCVASLPYSTQFDNTKKVTQSCTQFDNTKKENEGNRLLKTNNSTILLSEDVGEDAYESCHESSPPYS